MAELKPFMRGAGEPVPGRREQALAYRALTRFFITTYRANRIFIWPDKAAGNTLPIDMGPEMAMLTQHPGSPDTHRRWIFMLDGLDHSVVRYRATPRQQQVLRIAHSLDVALEIDEAIHNPAGRGAFFRNTLDNMRMDQAHGFNLVPVGITEMDDLIAYINEGQVMPGGGFGWLPHPH